MGLPRGAPLGLLVGALLFLSACATHRVATAPARPAPATPSPAPLAVGYEERGEASWYGHPYHGRRTASGEVYDMHQMTAAHRTLPFGTRIRVESLVDGSAVEVRINDRGPFKDTDTRILDLSFAAGKLLGVIGPGVIPVRLRVVSLPRPAAAAPAAATPAPPPPAAVSPPPAPVPPTAPTPPPAPVVSAQEPVSPPALVAPPILAEPPAPRAEAATRAEPALATVPGPRVEPPPRVDAAPRLEGWSVQLGAYASEATALTLRDNLARAWPEARVQRAEVGGRPVWRVRVGNYASRREADDAAKQLAASGYRVMVVEAPRP
jgi:rare lipoprotein A